jgi:hypothetical protein
MISGQANEFQKPIGVPQLGTLEVAVLYEGRPPKPIKGATVEIWNRATDMSFPLTKGRTDDNGKFVVTQLRRDTTYQIWAETPNGLTKSKESPILNSAGATPFQLLF